MNSKYHAQPIVYLGIHFDSKREAATYQSLMILKNAKDIKERVIDIVLQPEYVLQPGYIKNGKKIRPIIYRADFLVTRGDGRKEVVDSKGFRTEIFKLKSKLFHYIYPDLTIIEV